MNEVAIFVLGQISSLLIAALIISWGSVKEDDE